MVLFQVANTSVFNVGRYMSSYVPSEVTTFFVISDLPYGLMWIVTVWPDSPLGMLPKIRTGLRYTVRIRVTPTLTFDVST